MYLTSVLNASVRSAVIFQCYVMHIQDVVFPELDNKCMYVVGMYLLYAGLSETRDVSAIDCLQCSLYV